MLLMSPMLSRSVTSWVNHSPSWRSMGFLKVIKFCFCQLVVFADICLQSMLKFKLSLQRQVVKSGKATIKHISIYHIMTFCYKQFIDYCKYPNACTLTGDFIGSSTKTLHGWNAKHLCLIINVFSFS